MKAFLKRAIGLICALICVLSLAGAWTGVRLSADAGTYRLDDIEGDAAYLNGIRIGMSLTDAVHAQRLTLDNGALSHSCSFTSPLDVSYPVFYSNQQAFVENPGADVQENSETTLESSGTDYELWVTRLTRKTNEARISAQLMRHGVSRSGARLSSDWAQVVTDVTVTGEGYPFTFVLQRDTTVYKHQTTAQGEPLPDTISETPFSYAETGAGPAPEMDYSTEPLVAAASDGTVYFTPALMPYYGGTSAIYRVDRWENNVSYILEPTMQNGNLCYPDFNTRAIGEVTKVADFPAGGLRTIALDVAEGRLCLLVVEDGMLTLRTFSLSGEPEYALPLFAADPSQTRTSTLFTNKSGAATMLCYYLQDPAHGSYADPPPESDATLLCVRLGDTAELMSVLTGHNALVRAAFADGHWVLGETEFAPGPTTNYPVPGRYYISVLDTAGKTLYRGEVATDAQEDDIQFAVSAGTEYPAAYTVSRWLSFDTITEE